MKKLYVKVATTLLVACFSFSFNSVLIAQDACPAGGQRIFNITGYDVLGQPTNLIRIENFIPSGLIVGFQGSTAQTLGTTDASGNAQFAPPAGFTPDRISVVKPSVGECNATVPPAVTCSSTALNIRFPANATLGTPEFCVAYLSNSLAGGEVRVFNGVQTLIPTFSGAPAFTNIAGYVGFVYDCNALPTSVVTCAGGGCCSSPLPAAAALPIKLTTFTAKLSSNNAVLLNWVSNLEIGSDKYVIEKSTDGRNFTALGEKKSGGNTTLTRTYAYTDADFNATAYYRLKMVDIDGKSEYSKVVYVNLRGGSGAVTQIFPNPFKSDIQLIGISSSDLNLKNIRVFNATGQQVNFRITGANAITLDENAPRGLYILAVKEQRFKLIKE